MVPHLSTRISFPPRLVRRMGMSEHESRRGDPAECQEHPEEDERPLDGAARLLLLAGFWPH